MNPLKLCIAATCFVALSLPQAVAQMADTNQIVGWTNAPLLPASGNIDIQDIEGSCQAAKNLCSGVLLHNGLQYAGGSAYDPRHQSLWVSDGRAMEERALGSCSVLCKVTPSLMNSKAVVTGLAIADSSRRLYHLESTPGYLGILPWDNTRCPPIPTKGGCTMQLGATEIAGGIAWDEARNLLYFTVSQPGIVGWTNTLFVARSGMHCQPICKVPLTPCRRTPEPVTGLAYDSWTHRLYAAQGRDTLVVDVQDPLKCVIKSLACCNKQWGSDWAGLAVVPGWKQRSIDKSCLRQDCPVCTAMVSKLTGGDPSIGNQDFGLQLANGPAGRFALVVFGAGGCTKGLSIPVLCAPFYPNLSLLALSPPLTLTGTGTCLGSATAALPLPPDPGLCGATLCTQWIVFCLPVLGASNAIEFTITGS